jgi:hypothetical protein
MSSYLSFSSRGIAPEQGRYARADARTVGEGTGDAQTKSKAILAPDAHHHQAGGFVVIDLKPGHTPRRGLFLAKERSQRRYGESSAERSFVGHQSVGYEAKLIQRALSRLNSRPRKTLDWKTPAEALDRFLLSADKDRLATTA